MTTAFIFPGQGSQAIGMLADIAATFPIVTQTFAEASDILGYDLWQLTQAGPEELLNQTDKTQPALLAAEIALWRIWQAEGGKKPVLMAGHSFGEYSALTCAEALSYTQAVDLVQARGRFMFEAVPLGVGAVAAILGLDDAQIITACAEAAQGEVVSAVNFNAPGQVVIAGHATAVERAIQQAKALGAKRAMALPVSAPVHCALMQPAANRMAEKLNSATINLPNMPILHNFDVATHHSAEEIRYVLTQQIANPVRWTETIQQMAAQGIQTVVECGPGKVLSGLVKRIDKNINTLAIGDSKSLAAALEALA